MTWRVVHIEAYEAWCKAKQPDLDARISLLEWFVEWATSGPPLDGLRIWGSPGETSLCEAIHTPTGVVATYLVKPYHYGIVVRNLD